MKLKISILLAAMMLTTVMATAGADVSTIKQERNYINYGNKLYEQKRYADAEVMYRKALEAKPTSEYAMYNLATSLLRQAGTKDLNKGNNPLAEAQSLLSNILETGKTDLVVEKASYNLGNIAYNNSNYQGAIEYYKNALRKNPSNNHARQNLRLAQKKFQQQQNQQDKKDNKDNQNQDQQKDQQNQQDKKQDQNKNQQNKPQNQQDKDKEKQQQKQQQSGISDANAEQILKAMENEEAATRKRVEAQRRRHGEANRRQPIKPW